MHAGTSWSTDPGHQLCRFDNVCLDHSTQRFQYFVDPTFAGMPLFYDHSGAAHFSFPENFVSTGAYSKRASQFHIRFAPHLKLQSTCMFCLM
jgi:hypothetical protein